MNHRTKLMNERSTTGFRFNATVHNYASYPQAFPSVELTLTDPQDQPLASYAFDPKASLGENMNPAGAIAPDHEFNVRLSSR